MRTMTDVTDQYEVEDGTRVFEMSEPFKSGETLLKVDDVGFVTAHLSNGRWTKNGPNNKDLKLKPVPEKPAVVEGIKYKFLDCCGGHWFWVENGQVFVENKIDGQFQSCQTLKELLAMHLKRMHLKRHPGVTKPVKGPEQTAMDRVLKYSDHWWKRCDLIDQVIGRMTGLRESRSTSDTGLESVEYETHITGYGWIPIEFIRRDYEHSPSPRGPWTKLEDE